METKICSACKTDLPISEFYEVKRKHLQKPRAVYYQSACKQCCYERVMASYARRKLEGKGLSKLLSAAKTRAKNAGREFHFTIEEITKLQERYNKKQCELTGLPLSFSNDKKHKWQWPSLDRIRSSHGYTYSNVRIVCYAANVALGDWGEGVFSAMAKGYLSSPLINSR